MVDGDGLGRREVLIAGACSALGIGAAAAAPEEAVELLRRLNGGSLPRAGRVELDIPAIADDGRAVPVTISVQSPMTEDDHVTAIHLLAERNPNVEVAVFHLTPMSGKALVSTRIRLAQTQSVIAAARMSDGSVFMARAEVKVAIGGCG